MAYYNVTLNIGLGNNPLANASAEDIARYVAVEVGQHAFENGLFECAIIQPEESEVTMTEPTAVVSFRADVEYPEQLVSTIYDLALSLNQDCISYTMEEINGEYDEGRLVGPNAAKYSPFDYKFFETGTRDVFQVRTVRVFFDEAG